MFPQYMSLRNELFNEAEYVLNGLANLNDTEEVSFYSVQSFYCKV